MTSQRWLHTLVASSAPEHAYWGNLVLETGRIALCIGHPRDVTAQVARIYDATQGRKHKRGDLGYWAKYADLWRPEFNALSCREFTDLIKSDPERYGGRTWDIKTHMDPPSTVTTSTGLVVTRRPFEHYLCCSVWTAWKRWGHLPQADALKLWHEYTDTFNKNRDLLVCYYKETRRPSKHKIIVHDPVYVKLAHHV